MKIRSLVSVVKLLVFLILLAFSNIGFAQQLYNCTIQNITLVSPNVMEFDVYIQNTGSATLQLNAFQAGIDFNYIGMAGSGTITGAFVAGSNTLPAPQNAPNWNINATSKQIRMLAALVTSSGSAVTLTSTPLKLGTFRMTNTVPFTTCSTPNFSWSFLTAANKTKTAVTAWVNGGTSPISITDAAHAAATFANGGGPQHYVQSNPSIACCPTVSIGSTTPSLCYLGNGSAIINVVGGSGGTYTVDGGASTAFTGSSINLTLSQGSHSVSVTPSGCTATILNVTIAGPSSAISDTFSVTSCGSYTWAQNNNAVYTSSGFYSHTFTSFNNCDSLVVLNITINNASHNSTTQSACNSYNWNGNNYTTSGTYTYSYNNGSGCASVDTLHLTITPNSSNTTVANACNSYTWSVNNQIYTTSGTYSVTNGCHTENLNLTITPTTYDTTYASACGSYTWSINGNTYTQSGIYTMPTPVNSCLVHVLVLTITNSTSDTTNISACDAYTWNENNVTYTSSGMYSVTNGCHSEVLNLTITPSTSDTTNVAACSSYTWSENGQTYTNSGYYTTQSSVLNSVVGMFASVAGQGPNVGSILSVNPSTAASSVIGTPIAGHGITGLDFTSTGTLYGFVANGSSNPVTLIKIDPSTGAAIDTIGDVTYNGNALSLQDMAIDPMTNIIYGTGATGNNNKLFSVNATTAEATLIGQPVQSGAFLSIAIGANGTMYGMQSTNNGLMTIDKSNGSVLSTTSLTPGLSVMGLGIDRSTNILYGTECCTMSPIGNNLYSITPSGAVSYIGSFSNGVTVHDIAISSGNNSNSTCHTEVLNLTITPNTSNTTNATTCNSYTWSINNVAYTSSGTYTDTNGCHVEILNLTVTPTTYDTTYATTCDTYTWSVNGNTYTQSGIYTMPTPVNSCLVHVLNLTITSSTSNTTVANGCNSYTWAVNNQVYTTSGNYSVTNGCHTENLNLTITPSTSSSTVAIACDSYTWLLNGQTYTTSGVYTVINGCHTDSLVLTITPSTTDTVNVSACDSYTWLLNGNTYTSSGNYSYTNGCNTTYLNLTISSTPVISNVTSALSSICSGGSTDLEVTASAGGMMSNALGTSNTGNIGAENSYVVSPVLSLSSGNVTINFSSWSNNEGYIYDKESLDISFDGGVTWNDISSSINPGGIQNLNDDATWRNYSVNIVVPSSTSNARLRFRYDTGDNCCGGTQNHPGWYIDNVVVNQSNSSIVTYNFESGMSGWTTGNFPSTGMGYNSISSTWNISAFIVPVTPTYSWSPSGTLSSPTISNPIASPTSSQTYTVIVSNNGCSDTGSVQVTVIPVTYDTTIVAACDTYTWIENGMTYTSSGMYSSTNGCHTQFLDLTINPSPVISAGNNVTMCPNTPVVLTGSGGLSYTWNNGVSNGTSFIPTTSGTYTVIGTDVNGCSASASVDVNIKQFVLTSSNSVICKGTSVTLTAPAGTNYKWKKNGSTLNGKTASTLVVNTAGTYIVTYTDAQCGKVSTQPITLGIQNPPAAPTITPANVQICAGSTLTMYAPAGYSSYIWKLSYTIIPGATTNQYSTSNNGSYKVAVVDSFGCISTFSGTKTVKVNPLPTPNFTISTIASTGAKKLTSTNSGSFQWKLNGNPIPGATAKIYVATTSGSYSLTFTNSKGCMATTPDTSLTINVSGNMKEENTTIVSNVGDEGSNVMIYPNPSSGLFFIESSELVNAVVRDIQGKLIMNIKNAQEINLSEQPSGIYLLQLINEEGKLIQSVKLMKQ